MTVIKNEMVQFVIISSVKSSLMYFRNNARTQDNQFRGP